MTSRTSLPSRLAYIEATEAYKAIAEFYGDKRARKSQVPLINHIHEGLVIMHEIDAGRQAMEAYCLHPLCQDDGALSTFDPRPYDSTVVMYAIEYRRTANGYLASKQMPADGIALSPLKAVNDMLIADKVQNSKDFMLYQQEHPNHKRLAEYFVQWLEALGVSDEQYAKFMSLL